MSNQAPKLSHEEIGELKARLNTAWHIRDGTLFRHFDFKNFKQSKAFVDSISILAEEANHHPDITFSFKYVDIVLYSHSEQGLTRADFALAAGIDELS